MPWTLVTALLAAGSSVKQWSRDAGPHWRVRIYALWAYLPGRLSRRDYGLFKTLIFGGGVNDAAPSHAAALIGESGIHAPP